MKSLLACYLVVSAVGLVLSPLSRAQWMSLADSTAAPVVVESATITAEITGQFAVTTYDLTFHNPNARVLEGTFEFPLLDGQMVTRFALDIGGRLREAVPVAKERGRVVFEEIERRRVDPGLLEQTAGNNYRARIFPLPALGTRRIVIAYQESLTRDTQGEATFRLAFDFPQRLKRFTLAVSLHTAGAGSPKVRWTMPLTSPVWKDQRVLSLDQTDVRPTGVFELKLPRIASVAVTTQRVDDREYVYAEVPLPAIAPRPRPAPKVLGILWDASGSGSERDRAREFAFLDRWFASVPNVDVRLVLLRDTTTTAERFSVKAGNWSGLRRALKKTIYDGATSFDGLADDAEVEEWLLFSDGLINYGAAAAIQNLPLTAPVHTVVACLRADVARLRGLAARHDGEFVNLLATDAPTAATRVRERSLRVLGVERDPEIVAEVFPEVGAAVTEPTLAVAGVLRGAHGIIRLRVGHTIEDAREIEVPVQSGTDAGFIAARAWASAKISALSIDAERNRENIRRTSEAFGIVTADTSLIVLETLADYQRYAIAPPATERELRRQWELQRTQSVADRSEARDAHLRHVVASFERRQRWWELGSASNYRPLVVPPSRPASRAPARSAVSSSGGSSSTGSWPERVEKLEDGSDEIIVLSPFEVSAGHDSGYMASSTLSGSRLRSSYSDADGTRRERRARLVSIAASVGEESPVGVGDWVLQAWSPDAGYLERLDVTAAGETYDIYLEERAEHSRGPGFYLDVANHFFERGESALALRILSNLAELQLEDAPLLRVLGHRLMQASQPALALSIFERVLRIRGEDPQSRRDLALACAAMRQYQRAVDLLWEVVETPWPDRFPDIEMVALGELNTIVATCGEPLDLSRVDSRLRRNLAVGLRAVVTWDADNCDVDLWVDDPDGERAFFEHPLTRQGGLLSRDFTGGYGPEEFLLRDPKPGRYTVRVNYYGDQRNTALGPVTVQVRLITGFGTSMQREQAMTVRLTGTSETVKVGTIEVPARGAAIAIDEPPRASRWRSPRRIH